MLQVTHTNTALPLYLHAGDVLSGKAYYSDAAGIKGLRMVFLLQSVIPQRMPRILVWVNAWPSAGIWFIPLHRGIIHRPSAISDCESQQAAGRHHNQIWLTCLFFFEHVIPARISATSIRPLYMKTSQQRGAWVLLWFLGALK